MGIELKHAQNDSCLAFFCAAIKTTLQSSHIVSFCFGSPFEIDSPETPIFILLFMQFMHGGQFI